MTDESDFPAEARDDPDDEEPSLSPPEVDDDSEPRGLATALLLVVLVAVTALVGPTIASLGKPGPDEYYYLSYAQTLAERGPGAIRDLFAVHVGESRHWQYPNPLRVGYLAVAALWVRFDGASPQSLAHLSLVALLASLVVVYRLLARELGTARALATTALLAASPLWLAMARRALQDSFATFAALLALSAFWSALERPASRRRLALYGAALAFAIVTKESLVLLVPVFALWLAFEKWRRRSEELGGLALATAAAGATAGLVWIVAAGSFTTVRELVGIVLRSPATNAYAIRYGGGDWSRYLVDFVALSAAPTLLGVGGLALVLSRARDEPPAASRLPLFLALLATVTLGEYALLTKNVRYVMLLELPLRLFAVEALLVLVPFRAATARWVSIAAAVVLLSVIDVASFRELFVTRGLYDPMSAPLLELRGLVPPGK